LQPALKVGKSRPAPAAVKGKHLRDYRQMFATHDRRVAGTSKLHDGRRFYF